jgi:hypothetical protein
VLTGDNLTLTQNAGTDVTENLAHFSRIDGLNVISYKYKINFLCVIRGPGSRTSLIYYNTSGFNFNNLEIIYRFFANKV